MALKSQLDSNKDVEQKKVTPKTEKQAALNAVKTSEKNTTTKVDKTNNYKTDSLKDLQNYFSNLSKMTTAKNDLNSYSNNVKDVYSNFQKKREAEKAERANDPNNNKLVKAANNANNAINSMFGKDYQPDEATQKKEYDIFSGDTKDVRKNNADFIKQQAQAYGITEYDYVKQAKERANNIKESQSIINDELSKASTSLDENTEVRLANGTSMITKDYKKAVEGINTSFSSLNAEKQALEEIYNKQGFTSEQATRYNNIIEQMNGLITEAKNYDAVDAGWADFDSKGKELEEAIKDRKKALSLAQDNNDIQTAAAITEELNQLMAEQEANKQKQKDQEAYIISQNYEYVMNNGTAQEKEQYAKYIASRNDNILQRMYNMGTAAVLGLVASPFNLADLVLEHIDEYNGKNDYDPNNPNLISNKLEAAKNELNEYSLNGTEGAGRFVLQSIQSLMPFVTTILTAQAMGVSGDSLNAVTTIAQGVQVGAETAKQDIAQGMDLASAELHGTLMGAISTITEAIGGEGFIDMISGNAMAGLIGDGVLQHVNWADVVGMIVKSSLAEGVEEVMEDVGDRVANTFVNSVAGTELDDFSNLKTAEGTFDYLVDMGTSFAMAFVGSVILGAVRTGPGALQNNAYYNYLTGDMAIQTQEQFDLAQHLKEQLAQGIEFNNAEIAELQTKEGVEEAILKKSADSEAAQRAIRAIDALMKRFTESSLTKDRVILLNNKNDIPTVEQSYGTLLEALRGDITETIDLTNELATNTAIANKLTEQVLEQRNINVSTEEWAKYDGESQSAISFVSKSLQNLGIKDFSIEPMTDDTNGLNVNINGKNVIKLNANGNAVDIFTGKELSTAETVKRVAIHELWHRVENTEAGKQLKELLDKEKGMSKVVSTLENNDIEDITGEKYAYMLENTLDSEAFISQLVERKGSTLKTIVGDLKALFSKGNNKYFNDVLQKYEAALEEYNNVPEEQKFILEKELKSEKLGISAIKGFREQSVEIAKSTDNYQEIFNKIWSLYQEYGESQTMKNVFANTINRIGKGFYDRAEFEAFNEEIRKNNNVNELSDRLRDLQKQEVQLFDSGADLSNSFAMHKIQYERGAISDRIQQLNDEEALRNRDRTTLEEKALTFEQQIKLNDVSEIAYKLAPNGYYINAHNKSGGTVINGTYTKERLASAVGTTVANEIINKADVTMQRTNNIPKDTSIYEDEANVKEVVKMAKKEYGITNNPNVVGYMLPDGKYLNFGNPGINDNMRVTDHREAPYGMEFMKFGNIRMFPETAGFELIMKPNEKQQKALLNYLKTVKAPYGHFIGISNADMVGTNDIAALTFENGETPKQIMEKVMSYFPEEVKYSKKLKSIGENRHGFNIIEEFNENEYNSYREDRNIPPSARERLLFAQSKGVRGKGFIEDITGIYLVYGKEFDEFKVLKRIEKYEQFDGIRETDGSDILKFGFLVGYGENFDEYNNTSTSKAVGNGKLDDRSWEEEYYSRNDSKQGIRDWRGISITDSEGQKLLRNVRNILRYTKIIDRDYNVKRMYLQKQEGNTFFFSEKNNGTTPVYLNVINPKIVNNNNAFLDEKDITHDGLIRRSNGEETVLINNSKQIVKTDDTRKYSKKLNADYMKAANSNNIEEAQKLVDEAAIEWGALENNGKPINLYHGTNRAGFTSFDMEKSQNAVFLTEAVDTAQSYSGTDNVDTLSNYKNNFDNAETRETEISNLKTVEEANEWISKNVVGLEDTEYQIEHSMGQYRLYSVNDYGKLAMGNLPSIKQAVIYLINNINSDGANMNADHISTSGNYSVYAKMDNPIIVEGDGNYWNDLSVFAKDKNGKTVRFNNEYGDYDDDSLITTRDWCEYANSNGYDGVIFKDIVDLGGASDVDEWNSTSANVYAVLNANNIKSADAITYNDNGEVIPLNERFTDNEDIRYSKKLKKTKLTEQEQKVKDYVLRELVVDADSMSDYYAANLTKAINQYNSALNEESRQVYKSSLEYIRNELKQITGERYDLSGEDGGYDFTGRQLKRAMKATTLDWESIKKDLPRTSKEQQKIKKNLGRYFTIRSKGGVSPDVLIAQINEDFGLNIESKGIDMLNDLIDIYETVDIKNDENIIYSGMDQLESMYGFTEAEWDKKFDDLVKQLGNEEQQQTRDKINQVFGNVEEFMNKNKSEYEDFAKANGWLTGVRNDSFKQAEKDMKATKDYYDLTRQVFIENADRWIPNYDTLTEKYSIFNNNTLNQALYELLIEGAMKGDTEVELMNDIIHNDIEGQYTNSNLREDIEDFAKDTLAYFAADAALQADKKNIMQVAGVAMKLNKKTDTNINFEGNYETAKGIVEARKRTKEIKDKFKNNYNELAWVMAKNPNNVPAAKLEWKTFEQALDTVLGTNNVLRERAYELLEGRYRAMHEEYVAYAKNYNDILQSVINDYGIKGGSNESRLLQYILEGHTETINTDKGFKTYQSYNSEKLMEDANYKMENGKMAYENIQAAADKLSPVLDEMHALLIEIQTDIYGDVEGEAELKRAKLAEKVREAYGVLQQVKDEFKTNPSAELEAQKKVAERELNTAVRNYNNAVEEHARHDDTRRQLTPYRHNYMHHIRQQNFFEKLKDAWKVQNSTPTQLVGIESQISPNSAWASFMAQQDVGEYTPDAINSMAAYIEDWARVAASDPFVNEMRAFQNKLREYSQGTDSNGYVEYLDDWLNSIVGKRNSLDKSISKFIPNNVMNVARVIVGQAKKASLMFNVRSALVQVANIPNAMGIFETSGKTGDGAHYVGVGISQYLNKNSKAREAMAKSTFLAERFFDIDTQDIRKSAKVNELANTMMTVGDKMGSQIIWLGAYEQAIEKNVDDPVRYADDLTRRAVAGRGIGEVPPNLKSTAFNLFLPFQVETNNQWQTFKSQLSNKQYDAIIWTMMGSFVLNSIFSFIGAGDALPEFLSPILKELKKMVKKKQEGDDVSIKQLAIDIMAGEVGEFISMIPGGSDIINLALSEDDAENLFGDYSPSRYGTTKLGAKGIGELVTDVADTGGKLLNGEWYETLRSGAKTVKDITKNFAPAGAQTIRTFEGLQSMGALPQLAPNGVEITPVNYTNGGKIRYINDQTNIFDWLKAGTFGKWQTSAAQDYIDSGFKAKSASATNLYEAIEGEFANKKKAMDVAEGISKTGALKDDNGKTISNSKAMQIRKQLEEKGLYDEIIEKINNGVEPATYGLNKTVVGYSDSEFKAAYEKLKGGSTKKEESKQGDKSSKQNKVGTGVKKVGGTNTKVSKKTSSTSSKNSLTKKEESIYEAITKATKKLNGNSNKSVNATIASILSKVGKSGTDTQSKVKSMQKKLKNL